MSPFSRTALLLGSSGMEKIRRAKVAVFGLGGVGGYVVEALARSGIGSLELVDHDTISETNLNRQILATHTTIGMQKAEAARQRVLDIHPDCQVTVRNCFFGPDTADTFDFSDYSYVVDAIDTVTGKLALVTAAQAAGVPIISCMGTGNKLHPELFEITDISKTSVCPLARVMRRELKNRGISRVKVLYSKEEPRPSPLLPEGESARRSIPASISFVPATAGLMIAGEIVRDIAGVK